MRKAAFLIGILSVLAGSRSAWAAPCKSNPAIPCPLQYHGGPFLETFEIYPFFYGIWTEAERDTWQNYIVQLAAYMSGTYAPAHMQPVTKQYGVEKVTVAAPAIAGPAVEGSAALSKPALLDIIADGQAGTNPKLPAFGPHTLIVVLLGDGFTVHGGACGTGGGCHPSESITDFWAVIPKDQGLPVVGHEILEASADPAKASFPGWDEAVDGCNGTIPILPSFRIPPPTDNTMGGACTTSGYTSLEEKQDYGVSYSQFLFDNATLYSWAQGWNLYILQSYVLANGEVRYNAVWRAGIEFQPLLTNGTREQFEAENKTISSNGYGLYILQSYVLANGEVRYNAVWQRGTVNETVRIGQTQTQFMADNAAFTSPSGKLRLYILQTYLTASGDLLTNAVWRPGDAGEQASPFINSATFEGLNNLLEQLDWRLYILQSYVAAGGKTMFNAIWRPGTYDHQTVYEQTYIDYRQKYDKLYPDGWRLYILNTYVLPSGDVRYDAVWRRGTVDRPL